MDISWRGLSEEDVHPGMRLFRIEDIFGNTIELTRERWNHIQKHTITDQQPVREALIEPDVVRKSRYDQSTRLYYRSTNDHYTAVVAQVEEGFILTAYETETTKEGELLWQR
jgi:hypothetical protein